jgi:hypothetical protein
VRAYSIPRMVREAVLWTHGLSISWFMSVEIHRNRLSPPYLRRDRAYIEYNAINSIDTEFDLLTILQGYEPETGDQRNIIDCVVEHFLQLPYRCSRPR